MNHEVHEVHEEKLISFLYFWLDSIKNKNFVLFVSFVVNK